MKICPFFNAHVRKYAILTAYWRHPGKFPRHFWPLSDIAGYESWRFILIYEKAGAQNCRWNLPGWRRMATMRCAKRHARGYKVQRCRHRVGLLVNLYSVAAIHRLVSALAHKCKEILHILVHIKPLLKGLRLFEQIMTVLKLTEKTMNSFTMYLTWWIYLNMN